MAAEGKSENGNSGGGEPINLFIKSLFAFGGAVLLRRLTKPRPRVLSPADHARLVYDSFSGEKNSTLQARIEQDYYDNLRTIACPAAEMADGSKALYFEQAFWKNPHKPFRQRLYTVKPCPKEMECAVELSTYAISNVEKYKNFCDRPEDQRPLPEVVIGDIAEHLATVQLNQCRLRKLCLYKGTGRQRGFPEDGASYYTSEVTILKNDEVLMWDRGLDDDGNQVWGVRQGPYKFTPATTPAPFPSIKDS